MGWHCSILWLFHNPNQHDVSPILYIVFWFLFLPKAALRRHHLPAWLIYPLVYLSIVLIRGAIFKWYPYPFLEADKLGYPQMFMNVIMLLVQDKRVESL